MIAWRRMPQPTFGFEERDGLRAQTRWGRFFVIESRFFVIEKRDCQLIPNPSNCDSLTIPKSVLL
jgi:hypothetical protein